MPRRTESHIVGDMAVNQILEVCYACGWACERVQDDYGEDILVQTTLNEEVDPYRILVQSKGTREMSRYRRKKGDYAYSFPIETVRKWARSKDLVVVILWDVTKKYGFWTSLDQLNESHLFNTGSLSMTFEEKNVFDKRQATELAWRARISHYNYLMLSAVDHDNLSKEEGDSDHESRTMGVALDFLRRIGIVKVGPGGLGLDVSFGKLLKDLMNHFASEEKPSTGGDAERIMRWAGMMAFTAHLERYTKVGCTRELIMRCGTEAVSLLSALVDENEEAGH
jgi:hypothetical protein